MNVLILHAIGSRAGAHWEQWLHDQLVGKGHTVIMPNLPNPDHPYRTEWKNFVIDLIKDIDTTDLVIVGHSLGVVTAMDVIESLNKPFKGFISVSGFARDYGLELNSYFMKEKYINYAILRHNLGHIEILYGDNDPYVPQAELVFLSKALNTAPHIIPNGGHLNTEAGFTEFPLLIELIDQFSR